MKKESRKILGLIFIGIIFISFVAGMTAAQTSGVFDRWFKSSLSELDAKILIFLLVAVILLVILVGITNRTGLSVLISILASFIFTAYITPDAVLGVFRSYEAVPLTIATLLPLLIFFALTYMSVSRSGANRTLMTLQVVAWGVFFFYLVFKLALFLANSSGMNSWPIIKWFINPSAAGGAGYVFPAKDSAQAAYYKFALAIQILISGLMTFGNGWFMNLMVRHTAGTKDIRAMQNIRDMERGFDTLVETGQHAADAGQGNVGTAGGGRRRTR